ncbi:GIY-YIG nuclease family protein [Bacteroidota bacterium]
MYTIYAIRSDTDGRIYVGMTENLEKRLLEHNSGITKSTKGFRPWKLIFTEEAESRVQAREREKYWKSGCGKEQLKKLS